MARKCSSCGNNGHNSRTCSGHNGRTMVFENGGGVGGGGVGGGVRLFGVQLHVGSSAPMVAMKKCFSMECLSSSSAVAPAFYAAALAATNSNSPSASSSSSLVSVEEAPDKMANGYLSDGLMGRAAQERKKGVPWTEDEHRRFLAGLEKLGKGDWRGISRHFVTTRTPTQVASHAQKYFLRQSSLTHKKRRSSLFDVVENADRAATSSTSIKDRERLRLKDTIATTASAAAAAAAAAPGTTTTTMELPALSLGIISRPARRPADHVALPLPPTSLSLQLPRCQAAMSSLALAAPKHKHPSSSTLTAVATAASSSSQALPDLELKISTAARQSDVHHQVQTASSPPPRTPFLGTIRVT